MDTENRPTLLQSVYLAVGLELMGVQVIDSLSEQLPANPTEQPVPSKSSSGALLLQSPPVLGQPETVSQFQQMVPLLEALLGQTRSDPPSDPTNQETREQAQ